MTLFEKWFVNSGLAMDDYIPAKKAWQQAQKECTGKILNKIPHNKGLNYRLVNQLRNEIQKEFLE